MKKFIFAAGIVLALIMGWHIFLCTRMDNQSYSINPIADTAVLKMPGAASYGITDPDEAVGFAGGRKLTAVPAGIEPVGLQLGEFVAAAGVAQANRELVADQ